MENVKVTVWLSTYNQEPYVAQALDSILMQKTDFPFEIVAADDCSTDRTQEIILDYQKRYPGKIVTFFPEQNLGGCRKLTGCIDAGLFRGEYLSFLEGDDYWLGEDRLQTLVEFLETHPEYSRVAHRRKVIDEKGRDKGFDIPKAVLGKPFTIEDFLVGKNYSDFGSVFRNYFKQCGNKYQELYWASRNVLDFQDMFITQDFGPVFVMDAVYGVYRSISSAGAQNYNSITPLAKRRRDSIRIAQTVERFYKGKYDLSPLIRQDRFRLLSLAVSTQDKEELARVREDIPMKQRRELLAEIIYLSRRGRRSQELTFLREQLLPEEKRGLSCFMAIYALKRLKNKLTGNRPNERLRGSVR
jgi:glycosyltransferase involved in cell wall biosynthesis